jgi:hypothetical protein
MVEERFSDAERRRLLSLAMGAVPADRGDDELTAIIAKLSGADTVLIAQRAYKSRIVTARDPRRIKLRRRQDKEAGIE